MVTSKQSQRRLSLHRPEPVEGSKPSRPTPRQVQPALLAGQPSILPAFIQRDRCSDAHLGRRGRRSSGILSKPCVRHWRSRLSPNHAHPALYARVVPRCRQSLRDKRVNHPAEGDAATITQIVDGIVPARRAQQRPERCADIAGIGPVATDVAAKDMNGTPGTLWPPGADQARSAAHGWTTIAPWGHR